MTSLGVLLNDELYDRIGTLLPAVDVRYRSEQAGTADYVLFLHDDERQAREWSDKDGHSNDWEAVLQIWGSDPRTILGYAKTIIDSVESNPLTIAGFDFLRSEIEMNRNMPDLQKDGEDNEYARILQIRFFYRPNS